MVNSSALPDGQKGLLAETGELDEIPKEDSSANSNENLPS